MKKLLFLLAFVFLAQSVFAAEATIPVSPTGQRIVDASGNPVTVTNNKLDVNGGGGGAITAASGAFASGSISSGAVASGAIASGAVASGAVASGAYAAGSVSDGAIVTLGAEANDKNCASDTTAITLMAVMKCISATVQAATPAGTNLIGKVVPFPGALTAPSVTGAMTGTTSTQVIAAVASNYIYVGQCSFSNTHASVSTMMSLEDGSDGTVLWTGIVPFGGGSNVSFNPPLKVPTNGNGLYVKNITTGANTFATCSGWTSTVSY